MADGRIIIDHYDLQFLSAGVELRIPLNRLEIVRDKKGKEFEGIVCHRCKTVLWVRR